MSDTDLQQRIRERAYAIWQAEGCPEGRAAAHWELARRLEEEREEYLDVVVDAQQRKFLTEMRGGTNLLRVELGRWKGEQLEERTCSFCAMGLIEDEPHALLECSAYYRERRQLFSEILQSTRYDMEKMKMDQDWLLQMLLGVSCSEKNQRAAIQTLVAKFLGTLFRTRAKLLQAAQG